jgi:hypothetical protein
MEPLSPPAPVTSTFALAVVFAFFISFLFAKLFVTNHLQRV